MTDETRMAAIERLRSLSQGIPGREKPSVIVRSSGEEDDGQIATRIHEILVSTGWEDVHVDTSDTPPLPKALRRRVIFKTSRFPTILGSLTSLFAELLDVSVKREALSGLEPHQLVIEVLRKPDFPWRRYVINIT
jgi:hypothetical protein